MDRDVLRAANMLLNYGPDEPNLVLHWDVNQELYGQKAHIFAYHLGDASKLFDKGGVVVPEPVEVYIPTHGCWGLTVVVDLWNSPQIIQHIVEVAPNPGEAKFHLTVSLHAQP